MKKSLYLAAVAASFSVIGVSASANGIAYPYLGASKYCDAREMGMDHQSSLSLAVDEAMSSTVGKGSVKDKFNTKKMAQLIFEDCNDQWPD